MTPRRRGVAALATAMAVALAVFPAFGTEAETGPAMARWSGPGSGWLTDGLVDSLFPGAAGFDLPAGDPPAAAVRGADGTLSGYVFRTVDAVPSLGYASSPFEIAVGLRMDGTLSAILILDHSEPIIDLYTLADRVPSFVAEYPGIDIRKPHRVTVVDTGEDGTIDAISSATVSTILFNDAILSAARRVARARGIAAASAPQVDLAARREATFASLTADGSIARLGLPGGEIHFAPVLPPTIGRALLGKTLYNMLVGGDDPRGLTVILMARGWRFDPHALRADGDLERVAILQNGRRFALNRERYRYLNVLPGRGAPAFDQIGLYRVEREAGIDPLAPWRLEAVADGGRAVADYRLADEYIARPDAEGAAASPHGPAWRDAWRARAADLAILGVLLAALVGILLAMGPLTRRPRLYAAVRVGFLLFVLVWLGWIAGAQLTVLNLLTWARAFFGEFTFAAFMSDPLIAALALFVVATFVVWGRGVFCGWLCPFGALQELLAKLARALRIPAAPRAPRLAARLKYAKYAVLALLVALSFHSMAVAGAAAEIEPFKTAITLGFSRAWPYVAWAAALLAAGLFVERFFCRFLCPLGAAMAIGGKLRLRRLAPLPRRAECGSPCHLCARKCPVNAIRPDGVIDMDECFYCLDCQVAYRDDTVCPPRVAARRRRAALEPRARPA